MTLLLTDPTGPVTQFDGGVVMVRCADFVDGPRATLAVVTDADSVCGDVVHETQLIAYDTSAGFGSPYAADYEFVDTSLADATLRIPISELGLRRGVEYIAYVGVKVVGDGDINHKTNEDFLSLSDQNARIRGYNDTIDDTYYPSISPFLPRPEVNAGYRIKWFSFIEWVTQAPAPEPYHAFNWNLILDPIPTEMIVVAAAGEDSSYELYLDALYFVPYGNGPFILQPADLTAYDPLRDAYTGDLGVDSTADDDVATNALDRDMTDDAQYSVIFAEADGFGTNWSAPGGDYQGAKTEPTAYNVMNYGYWSGPVPDYPDDPKTWIAMTASRIHIPAQTVEAEAFATDYADPVLSSWTFPSDSGLYYWRVLNDNSALWTTEVASGSLKMTGLHCDTVERDCLAILGSAFAVIPVTGSPSHSSLRQTLGDMHAAILEATAAIDVDAADGVMNAFVGFWQSSWPRHQSSGDTRTTAGVCLYLDGGDLKATLRIRARTSASISPADDNFGTAPVTIEAGYSLGDLVRVKVERKYYVWRAKIWMDGDSEPGSWTLEGFLPNVYSDTLFSPTAFIVSAYPYSNAARDEWGRNCRVHTNWFPALGGLMEVFGGATSSVGELRFGEATLSYDPGGATPVSSFVELEKWNGSENYGQVEIETDRVIIASVQQHTFDDDVHGFNIYLWNNTSAPDLQVTCMTDVIMRVPEYNLLGLYYKAKA